MNLVTWWKYIDAAQKGYEKPDLTSLARSVCKLRYRIQAVYGRAETQNQSRSRPGQANGRETAPSIGS